MTKTKQVFVYAQGTGTDDASKSIWEPDMADQPDYNE